MPSALVPRGWQEAGGHPCAEAVYPTPPPLGVLMISQAPAEADPPKTGAAYLRLAPGDGCGHVTTVEGGGCWSGRLGATLGGERARVEVPRRRAGGGGLPTRPAARAHSAPPGQPSPAHSPAGRRVPPAALPAAPLAQCTSVGRAPARELGGSPWPGGAAWLLINS